MRLRTSLLALGLLIATPAFATFDPEHLLGPRARVEGVDLYEYSRDWSGSDIHFRGHEAQFQAVGEDGTSLWIQAEREDGQVIARALLTHRDGRTEAWRTTVQEDDTLATCFTDMEAQVTAYPGLLSAAQDWIAEMAEAAMDEQRLVDHEGFRAWVAFAGDVRQWGAARTASSSSTSSVTASASSAASSSEAAPSVVSEAVQPAAPAKDDAKTENPSKA